MTQFELKDDFRTVAYEAVSLLGLSRNEIAMAAGYHDLFKNLSPAKKQLALAAVEVYKLFSFREQRDTVRNSEDIYKMMASCMHDLEHEEGWLILMNNACRVIRKVRVSVGGLDYTCMDVRILLREALLANATAIVLVHNHPSGNTRPSTQDDRLTDSVKKGGGSGEYPLR